MLSSKICVLKLAGTWKVQDGVLKSMSLKMSISLLSKRYTSLANRSLDNLANVFQKYLSQIIPIHVKKN